MRHLETRFEPTALVELTAEEIVCLYRCSRAHYDPYCRSLSECGDEGLIYGFVNRVDGMDERFMLLYGTTMAHPMPAGKCTVSLNSTELDILMKVLEIGEHEASPMTAISVDLKAQLLGIFRTLQQQTPDVATIEQG